MTLYDKIKELYPSITDADFALNGTIQLQNDLDDRGDYIAKWDHPTLPRLTDEQLAQE
jgi:hypothetical protein